MKITAIITVLVFLIAHAVMSSLAIMQAKRFRYLSKTAKHITWCYIGATTIISITTFVLLFTIEF